ncbi:MAG: diguanylate cyclase [bacterium]
MGKPLISILSKNPERFRPVTDALRAIGLHVQTMILDRENFPALGQQDPDVVIAEALREVGLIRELRQSLASRETPGDTPVILLSDETDREDEFFEVGIRDVLPRNVDDHRLIARINLQLALKARVDELKRLGAFFHSRQQTDGLTNLYLFPILERRIESEVARATAENPFSLCLIHLDQFMKVNADQGHMWGDLLMMELAHLLRELLPGGAMAARYSADRVAVVLSDTGGSDAGLWAENLREKVRNQPFVLSEEFMSVSIGIIAYPEEGVLRNDALLQLLVERTEHAAAEGGNRVVALPL